MPYFFEGLHMTGDELRNAIDALGLSQTGTAKALGVDPRTMRYWLANERPIPRAVEIVLGFLAMSKDHEYTVAERLQLAQSALREITQRA